MKAPKFVQFTARESVNCTGAHGEEINLRSLFVSPCGTVTLDDLCFAVCRCVEVFTCFETVLASNLRFL